MTCEVENLSTEHLRIECNRDTGCDDAVIINANGLEMIEGVTYNQIEYLEHATRVLQDRFSPAARLLRDIVVALGRNEVVVIKGVA